MHKNGYQFVVLLLLGAVMSLWLMVGAREVYRFSVRGVARSVSASQWLSNPERLAFAKGAN